MSGLYGHYYGRLLRLSRNRGWGVEDNFGKSLPSLTKAADVWRHGLCNELSAQIELEALCFADLDKQAVLTLALKHFDAGE
jgi:hypothetical protein